MVIKTSRQLERYFKGAANHHRIKILTLLAKRPGLSLDSISRNLDANLKTISEHTKKLVQAGLLNKKYKGRLIEHTLSPYGERFFKFIKSF